MNAIDKMMSVKTNSRVAFQKLGCVIHVHLTDGSVESFTLNDEVEFQSFWENILSTRLFSPSRLVLAGEYSKSVFVTTQIVRVDIIHKLSHQWEFPGGYTDMAELSAEDFRKAAHLDSPGQMPKRNQPTQAGDFIVSFLKLYMVGGEPVYLMVEAPAKLPVENLSFLQFLLSQGSFHMRLCGGGVGVVNLGNLLGYTAYPGVPQVPADSWLAEPILSEASGS